MKKLFNSSFFQIYIFVLAFFIINVFIILKIDVSSVGHSFTLIYSSWVILIILKAIISYFLDFKKDEDV